MKSPSVSPGISLVTTVTIKVCHCTFCNMILQLPSPLECHIFDHLLADVICLWGHLFFSFFFCCWCLSCKSCWSCSSCHVSLLKWHINLNFKVFTGAWECLIVQLLVYFNLIKITPINLFCVCCFMDCPWFLYSCLSLYFFIVL